MEMNNSFCNRTNHSLSLAQRTGEGLGCGSCLILTGFVAGFSCLQEADATNGGKYQFMTLELRTDEPMPQTPVLFLTGSLAVQLSSCQLTPQTQLRTYLRIYSRPYADRDGVEHKTNEVACWKIDVLDAEGNTVFTCRRS